MSDREQRETARPADASPGYETSDTRGRSIFFGLLIGAVLMTIIAFALNELFVITKEDVVRRQVGMRTDPKLNEVRARTTRNLTTYEWVDSANGIARIPIERAMELEAEEAYLERSGGEAR
ncbi:MAG: hypothetical protein MAG453_00285 [Calditrichaeota bacterium]|nr:hypothetical protein [Calditrichota bacterium]